LQVPELVNTEEGIINMLAACQKVKQIAIDLEGISLSRHGKVCLLALATSATSVWVIDTITLGQAAFEAASKGQQSLKALLESPEVR
jgi:ribonuclease D